MTRRTRLAAIAVGATVLLVTVSCGADDGSETVVSTSTPGTNTPTVTTRATTSVEAAPAPPSAVAGLTTIAGSAAVTSPAQRTTPPPATECERIAAAVAGRHDAPTQQIIVRSDDWDDTTVVVEVATRVGGSTDGSGGSNRWVCGPRMEGRVGRTGTTPLLERRSGDGSTPAGVFPLATMTAPDGQRFSFFGNAPDPGVGAGTYRRARTGDCFGATPNTPGYGHLRSDTDCPGPDDEYLPRFVGSYAHAALIGANTEPDVSGDAPGEIPYASAIFLHRHAYVSGSSGPSRPTSGCVSLALDDLTAVLVGMTADTRFVIGPTDWLLTQA